MSILNTAPLDIMLTMTRFSLLPKYSIHTSGERVQAELQTQSE